MNFIVLVVIVITWTIFPIALSIVHRKTHRHNFNKNVLNSSPSFPPWKNKDGKGKNPPNGKKKSNTCCLIISIDNRPFNRDYDAKHYPSMTAVLNHDYAEYHGYDYLYYSHDLQQFIEDTMQKYDQIVRDPMMDSKQPDKDIATAFHVGLRQFRAASWAKLPPLWYLNWLFHNDYEYVWYIDSDAVISPLFRNRSIPAMIERWNRNPQRFVLQGQSNLSQASLIFFNNYPWRDNMPCAGSFLFRPSLYLDQVLRQWWDYNLPVKNFKHFHEQDALWHMIEAETSTSTSQSFLINSNTYSIVKELQFPSAWTRYEDLWLVHIASYNYLYRMPILYQFLHLIGKGTSESYYLAVQHLEQSHILTVKPLPLCEEMERLSQSEQKSRITSFPPHEEATQHLWYDAHVTSKTVPTLSLSQLWEGRLIRRKGEFWLVQQGLKRGFQNYQTFLALQIQQEWAHHLRVHDLPGIPDGPLISATTLSAAEKQSLLRYYLPMSSNTQSSVSAVTATDPASARINFQESEYASYLFQSSSSSNNNSPRVQMYIISHNNETEALAKDYLLSCCHHSTNNSNSPSNNNNQEEEWIKSLQITSTIYFESIIYQVYLPALLSQWQSKEYVITATYKTLTKTLHYNQYTQSMTSVLALLKLAMDYDYDLIPFLRSGSGLISFCKYWHGQPFITAWYALLQAMGYSRDVIKQYEEIKPFYRNIFIIRSSKLKELMQFMQQAIEITRTRPEIYALLAVDSGYKEGKEEVALRIFGTKYYQLFPFVFERLPAFYVFVNRWKVCADTIGPCKYNS